MINYFLVFILGLSLMYLFLKCLPKGRKKLAEITILIKSYWKISIIILILSIILHILNYLYSPNNIKQLFFEAINFYSGLMFAIFVGYFAFSQLQLNRLDKLVEEAYDELRSQSYARAEKLYKEALLIEPFNYTVVCNLTELSLFVKDNELFDDMIYRLEKCIIEDEEKLVCFYLRIAKALLKQDLGLAKIQISEMVKYIINNPNALVTFKWDFRDMQKSEAYKQINGESKEIFDTLIKYLQKDLPEEDKQKFINNYKA